ncbi:MAG TPA: hypothetical protein PK014_05955 [Thermoanaerobaculia bacterium]|nr:hypothetical protein [Thermoanaerobaculia bacterium]HUM29640.1 hypothetical protein [Thermoanaerobaculia bacterium]HXK67291.1 hypothetical protein [Thermoanaerobaculia bacterium]
MRETKLWTWHILAGIVILVFLGLHMIIMHMDAVLRIFNPSEGAAIDWGNVVYRARMVFFMITYIVLLGAALFHGLYGVRTIIHELTIGEGLKKFASRVLLLLGFALFVIGTYAAIAARSMAAGAM